MARPIVLGVAGDSGSGKTTLTRGLIRVVGDDSVARISADDYHRYERRERKALGITPLHPDANHLDVLTQHLRHLRRLDLSGNRLDPACVPLLCQRWPDAEILL